MKKTDTVIKKYLNFYSMEDLESLQKNDQIKNPKVKPVNLFNEREEIFRKKNNKNKFHPKNAYLETKNIGNNLQSENYDFQDDDFQQGKQDQDEDDFSLFKKKMDKASTDAKANIKQNIKKSVNKITKEKKSGKKKIATKKLPKKKKTTKKVDK